MSQQEIKINWESIFSNMKAELTLSQLCDLSPEVARELQDWMKQRKTLREAGNGSSPCSGGRTTQEQPRVCFTAPEVADHRSPRVTVKVGGTVIPGVIVDGGSGVNIMSETTRQALGLRITNPAPFAIRVADQREVTPLGMVSHIPVSMEGLTFHMNFVILDLPPTKGAYSMLIGRPWLRAAQVIHDWGQDSLQVPTTSGTVTLALEKGMDVYSGTNRHEAHPVTSGSHKSAEIQTEWNGLPVDENWDPFGDEEESAEPLWNWLNAYGGLDCMMGGYSGD